MVTDVGESVKWKKEGRYRYDFIGLSTDEKPMDRGNGSTFLEMDTEKVFFFDRENNEWVEWAGSMSGDIDISSDEQIQDLINAYGTETKAPSKVFADLEHEQTLYNDIRDRIAELEENKVDFKTLQNKSKVEMITARTNIGLSMRLGFKREKNNSSPTDRITYLYDAVGYQPTNITFGADGRGTLSFGDWEWFVNAICRPVMLKNDGIVDYELDHNDHRKKIDGTESDIRNISYKGNAMVEFGPLFKWVKRYEDENYDYVIFSNIQYDASYHAYAHTNENGEVQDNFYVGMQTGPISGEQLRSMYTNDPVSNNETVESLITLAKNNGIGWNILYKSAIDYISDILTLISKSDNSQASFGTGVENNGTAVSNRKPCNDNLAAPCFLGYNDNKHNVNTLWITNYWGNVSQAANGCVSIDGKIYVKMIPPYCDTPITNPDYSDYADTGIEFTEDISYEFITSDFVSDNCGLIPVSTGGSSTTYIPDILYVSTDLSQALRHGGYYTSGAGRAGSRAFNFVSFGLANNYHGSRLTYIPTRETNNNENI